MPVPGPSIQRRRAIPASAHCAAGALPWTMSHPRTDRLELTFDVPTPTAWQRISVQLQRKRGIVVQALTIDRQTDRITVTGLLKMKQVTWTRVFKHNCQVKYRRAEGGQCARIAIVIGGTLSLELNPGDGDDMYEWIAAMAAEDPLPHAAPVDRHIPAEATCANGDRYWTMSHPANGRFELRFGLRTPHVVERWLANLFWLAFAGAVAYGAWPIWRIADLENRLMAFFALACGAATIVAYFYPRLGMRVQELIIDRAAGTVSTTGLVRRKQVTFVQRLDQVRKVDYQAGTVNIQRPEYNSTARIDIHFLQPRSAIRLDRLAVDESRLERWISLMVR
jgi:hypothetical protein